MDTTMGGANSWEARYRRARDFLLPWVAQTVPLRDATVLEYGSGFGPVGCAAADHGAHVIGLDIDPDIVEGGRRYVHQHGSTRVELRHHPPEAIFDAVAALRGEIDIFLCYAVLEHMTLEERLKLLRLAREVVRPDGAIVVCETPNRLFPFDHHTAQLPFFHLLPLDLAVLYHERSEREDFRETMSAAVARGPEAAREALTRLGMGVSYHDFELAFDSLADHVIASNYEPALFPERQIFPEELTLARYLERARPDLAPAWSRAWLDLILTPEPHGRRPTFLRPWAMTTTASPGVEWTTDQSLWLTGPEVELRVALPVATHRLVFRIYADEPCVALRVRQGGAARRSVTSAEPESASVHCAVVELAQAADRVDISLDVPGAITFVGYDA